MTLQVRHPDVAEIDPLAQLWYDAWQDGHAGLVPEALARERTVASFVPRLHAARAEMRMRVVGPDGAPLGFCIIKGDELYQLFVAASARGTGAAAMLIADAETRLASSGVRVAWLACAIGNQRAARFYEKCGWHLARTIVSELDTPTGRFDLEVWRYEKALNAGS